jgi:hypothetical protein
MSLLNSYICPKCGNQFPLFLSPSTTIRKGLFSAPDLKCQRCGQISHAKVDFKSAVICWPLVGLYMVIMHYALRSEFFRNINKNAWWLYVVLVFVLYLLPLLTVIRRGFKLVVIQDNSQIKKTSPLRWLPLLGIILFLSVFGYYTHNWSNVIIGTMVGIIVYSVYYHFRRET